MNAQTNIQVSQMCIHFTYCSLYSVLYGRHACTLSDSFRLVYGWNEQVDIICFSQSDLVVINNFLASIEPIANPLWAYFTMLRPVGQPMILYIDRAWQRTRILIVRSFLGVYVVIEPSSVDGHRWFIADSEAYLNLRDVVHSR